MGAHQFGIPRELVLWFIQEFKVLNFVETGTNHADTAIWAASNFAHVTTIEGFAPLYDENREAHGDIKNIEFVFGDSRDHLERIVAELSGRAIFWLDAHWCGDGTFGRNDECPVLRELQMINDSNIDHFVLIDDARLFLAPPPPPHVAAQWPDIWEICSRLKDHISDRHIIVHNDVIIAVPHAAKQSVVEHLRSVSQAQDSDDTESPFRSLIRLFKRIRIAR